MKKSNYKFEARLFNRPNGVTYVMLIVEIEGTLFTRSIRYENKNATQPIEIFDEHFIVRLDNRKETPIVQVFTADILADNYECEVVIKKKV